MIRRNNIQFDPHCPHCHGSGRAERASAACGCRYDLQAREYLLRASRARRAERLHRACWSVVMFAIVFGVLLWVLL